MKITGFRSICCGVSVKTLTHTQYLKGKKEHLYKCLKCNKPCDAYFTCEIQRTTGSQSV